MGSIRIIKKDIEYLVEEVLSDCCLSVYFHPAKKEEILTVMQKAVDLRNDLFERVNNPAEKNNPSLVKKHYAQIKRDMFTKVDDLFGELSEKCK